VVDLKFGKREPLNKPALMFADIATGVIPDHPAMMEELPKFGWRMLGNDQYGDCVAVTWANNRRVMTRLVGEEHYPDLSQVLELYGTQNDWRSGEDNGMYVQACLEHLNKNGGPDGVKAVAFAKVDWTNEAEVEAASWIFRNSLWIGTAVQRANLSDFDARRPWDYHEGSSIVGYHGILGGDYDSDLSAQDQRMATGAELTGFTRNGFARLVDELWVVIWPEHFQTQAFQVGVDRQKLADAYKTLTGRDLPLPPEPPPVVVEDADPNDVELARALRYWIATRKAWSGKTPAGKAVKEAREWLDAKNLWYV